ncbi:hypothetical protein QFC24_006739 [Naganishia onofrii]|uniref:Uncharacterized protein n=1 Tax=Naganishia onofrii TaxID=1851511 RepID=A0ACC2WZD6_9TREE|nr:hypothetical protein QFC24_006739 [Naganishia onofrii]
MFSWLPYVSAPVPIRRTPSPTPGSTTSSGTTTPPSSTIGTAAPVPLIPPIPPTTNPRGELIFSSRVDKTFKEGYERYRAAFERRRAEKMRERRGEAPLWKFLAVVGVWKVAVPVVSHGAGGNGNGGVAGQRQGGRPLQVGRRAPGSASPSPNRHAAGVQATA